MNASEIEIALSGHINFRQNLIVPNVSYGMLPYEADLVIVRPSGYAVEVEIKVSASDIRADLKKRHHHESRYFRELWFAVPLALAGHPDIPERAGIYAVTIDTWGCYRVKAVRRGHRNPLAKRRTTEDLLRVAHLGCMRVWSLKHARWHYDRRRKEHND